ncbi:MAG: hypothetical protein IJ154_06945 [Bacteroidales bacterium]|nr:hypothetical protein [Bacteroidales bacterium]
MPQKDKWIDALYWLSPLLGGLLGVGLMYLAFDALSSYAVSENSEQAPMVARDMALRLKSWCCVVLVLLPFSYAALWLWLKQPVWTWWILVVLTLLAFVVSYLINKLVAPLSVELPVNPQRGDFMSLGGQLLVWYAWCAFYSVPMLLCAYLRYWWHQKQVERNTAGVVPRSIVNWVWWLSPVLGSMLSTLFFLVMIDMLCLYDGILWGKTLLLYGAESLILILTVLSLVCYLFLPLLERSRWLTVLFVTVCHIPYIWAVVWLMKGSWGATPLWELLFTAAVLYLMYATYFLPMLLSGYLRRFYRLRDRY